jgi:hypothetical protein
MKRQAMPKASRRSFHISQNPNRPTRLGRSFPIGFSRPIPYAIVNIAYLAPDFDPVTRPPELFNTSRAMELRHEVNPQYRTLTTTTTLRTEFMAHRPSMCHLRPLASACR